MSTTVNPPKTPECEKLAAVREKSQAIGEFLEWLQCEREPSVQLLVEDSDGGDYALVGRTTEQLLAEFFNIDLDKVENERRELLLYCRLTNEEREQRKQLSIE